ncbi:hypothetical protein [Georgenia alba]|uniref:Cytochrome d ubiquinol oxidase subunit II n=1 Tax=Georgenia alba TaxID=2233858 RepID=A0ABW2QDA8_9MICO
MPDPQPPQGSPFLSPRQSRRDAEPDPEAQRRAIRTTRLFGLSLLLVVALTLLQPPWPVPVATAVLAGASVALGVVGLVRIRLHRVRGALTVAVLAGLLVAGFMAMATSAQVLLWREYQAYGECLESAITQQARDACQARLERSLEERMDQMMVDPARS